MSDSMNDRIRGGMRRSVPTLPPAEEGERPSIAELRTGAVAPAIDLGQGSRGAESAPSDMTDELRFQMHAPRSALRGR